MRKIAQGLGWLLLAIFVLMVLVLAVFRWRADQRETQSAADIAPRNGRYVKAVDVDIFIQEAGPESGQAVLFMHGTGAWSGTWRPTLDLLARAGFRAVALDLPPFGHSQRPAQADYSKAMQARRIAGVLDALKVERVILVGHSFGGGPTVEAALLVPHRVKALILVDAALSIVDDGAASAPPSAWMNAFFAVTPVRDGVVATFLTNPLFTRRLLQAFVADPASATDERVAIYQHPLVIRGSTPAIGAWLPELLAPPVASKSESAAAYRNLAMPVAAIWGARDSITPLSQGERIIKLVPDGKLAVMPRSGHIPQIENPDEFHRILLELLLEMRANKN